MSKKRVRPMPTEEEKARARLKAESMDPLVWAMKSVDAAFPDARGQSEDELVYDDEEDYDEPAETKQAPDTAPKTTQNIRGVAPAEAAKGAAAAGVMPEDDMLEIEVTPMRQDVSELKKAPQESKNLKTPKEIRKENRLKKKAKKKAEKQGKKTVAKGSLIEKVKGFDTTQKRMAVAVGVMALAAFAGILFGVVSIVRQGETTKELTEQIALAQENAKIIAQENTADGDYINLKDWNLRIKIATGLTYVSYNYASDEYSEVMIWGAKRDTSANYSPEFVNQSKNASSMGTVVRVPRYERAAAGRLIWYDDYYNYYYQGPSGVPNVSEDEMSWWVESYLLIKEMLTNADNYEKFEQDTVGQT